MPCLGAVSPLESIITLRLIRRCLRCVAGAGGRLVWISEEEEEKHMQTGKKTKQKARQAMRTCQTRRSIHALGYPSNADQ
jgi:hypothetical protein